jgi:chromosome segregation ATPase
MSSLRPFIALGAPRGTARTSLDKFIDLRRQEGRLVPIVREFPVDDLEEQIAALQREQSRLCEELSAERRRSESLKLTYNRALALSASQEKEKLQTIRRLLQSDPEKSRIVRQAIKFLADADGSEGSNVPELPNLAELSQQTKEAELALEKENKVARALARRLEQVKQETADIETEIAQCEQQLADAIASRRAMKEKCKTFTAHVKKREARWKEAYAARQEELAAQT